MEDHDSPAKTPWWERPLGLILTGVVLYLVYGRGGNSKLSDNK